MKPKLKIRNSNSKPADQLPAGIQTGNDLKAAAGEGPKYDAPTSSYDAGLHYAVGVGEDPMPQGAKVKLQLYLKSDPVLSQFSTDHIAAMTGNTNFPTPTPNAVDFLAGLDLFQEAYSAAEMAKASLKEAIALKDEARAYLELLLNQRGNYVQIASNGNAPVILSAGFPVKNARVPVGELAYPLNLQAILNGTPGVLHLSWNAVSRARSYVIQCSPADTMAREWAPLKMSSTPKLKIEGLVLGKTYAFRVAAVGGSTDQSDWSAEAVRMAA